MGLILVKLSSYFFQKKINIAVVGLDNSGKTTIIYQLKNLCSLKEDQPLPNYNKLSLTHRFKNLSLVELDLGQSKRLQPLYKYDFQDTHGVIFTIDSNDTDSFEFAKENLKEFIVGTISKEVPLLIYANKADLCDQDSKIDLSTTLDLQNIPFLSQWKIQQSCAVQQDQRIVEGFQWLLEQINKTEA